MLARDYLANNLAGPLYWGHDLIGGQMEDPTKAVAGAVEASAKAAEKALDVSEKLGTFLARVFGASVRDLGEVVGYHTALWRMQNLLTVGEKADKLLKARGIQVTEDVSRRIGIPLLQAAADEDDPVLQDLWAGLLASAMEARGGLFDKKSYIEVARLLDPSDASTLEAAFDLWLYGHRKQAETLARKCGTPHDALSFWLSLQNLERLGIVKLSPTARDGYAPFMIFYEEKGDGPFARGWLSFSSYGFSFARAVTGKKMSLKDGGEGLPVEIEDYQTTR